MKQSKYIVWFSNGNYPEPIEVFAFNQQEALILAQAERIKTGGDYTLSSITAAERH